MNVDLSHAGVSAPTHARSRDGIVAECATVRMRSGVVGALRYLNARTRFRFTGVYHADPPLLRNVFLFDRENPALNVSGENAPLEETYCSITYATHRPFLANDAPRDPRAPAHAACDPVISYAGVPIRRGSGMVWGTLCHFDVRPRLLESGELEVLEIVAPLFGRWLDPSESR